MNWPNVMEQTATYYADLAQQPGWLHYCKRQLMEMEAQESGVWRGLLELVRAKIEAGRK